MRGARHPTARRRSRGVRRRAIGAGVQRTFAAYRSSAPATPQSGPTTTTVGDRALPEQRPAPPGGPRTWRSPPRAATPGCARRDRGQAVGEGGRVGEAAQRRRAPRPSTSPGRRPAGSGCDRGGRTTGPARRRDRREPAGSAYPGGSRVPEAIGAAAPPVALGARPPVGRPWSAPARGQRCPRSRLVPLRRASWLATAMPPTTSDRRRGRAGRLP